MSEIRDRILSIFESLFSAYGPRKWWPGETPFEVCAGAILTQNTNWGNVEKAILNIKSKGALNHEAIYAMPEEELALLIKPAGYFNVKARRLKEFSRYLEEQCCGSLELLFTGQLDAVRERLLEIKGIGPETADSMLLYAGNQPSFVVDAYTRRIFSRLGLVDDDIPYAPLRAFFMDKLPADIRMFNEYHALIVEHAKRFCRARPECSGCPVVELCTCRTHS